MSSPRIRHALIMAAGRGLRMGPLTSIIPKPMAPYLDSTLIGNGIAKIRARIPEVHVTVGYKGAMLAQHLVERGVDSIFNTEGHGNAWWLFHTLIRHVDEPIFVLTCDNVTEVDFAALEEDYFDHGAPLGMLVPVKPVDGVDGDYITHDAMGVVTTLSRDQPAPTYASGIQVLRPNEINRRLKESDNFYDVWTQLIAARQLYASSVQPQAWFSVDTLADLERLRGA